MEERTGLFLKIFDKIKVLKSDQISDTDSYGHTIVTNELEQLFINEFNKKFDKEKLSDLLKRYLETPKDFGTHTNMVKMRLFGQLEGILFIYNKDILYKPINDITIGYYQKRWFRKPVYKTRLIYYVEYIEMEFKKLLEKL